MAKLVIECDDIDILERVNDYVEQFINYELSEEEVSISLE